MDFYEVLDQILNLLKQRGRVSYPALKYELLSFDNDIDPEDGILVNVRRLSDKKTFVLALAKLEATKRKSANRQVLDDYAIWFTTWGD
jgi:hypothetical protein